jgi:hypothetical protein
MPVISLNDQPVADAKPGELYKRMSAIYAEYKERIKQGLED